jgi:hypothetical protein
MASSPATFVHVEPPTVATCPKCNVALIAVQVKQSGSGTGFIGGLIALIGVIGLFISFVGGLVLIGLGIVVASVGGKQPGLMCPNCGTQAATLSGLARKVMPTTPPPTPGRPPHAAVIGLAVSVVTGCVVALLYMIVMSRTPTPETVASTAALTPKQVVLTRISADRYQAEDGTEITTHDCGVPAEKVPATFQYDPHASNPQAVHANNKITFPSGRSCVVIYAVRPVR